LRKTRSINLLSVISGILLCAVLLLPTISYGHLINSGAILQAEAAACVQPPPNMVSWWPGDGNANDIVGTNLGNLHGATFAPGKVDQALSFNGVNAYVDLGTGSNLNFGTNPFTFDLWVNFQSLSGDQVIIEKYIETFDDSRTGIGLTKLDSGTLRLYGHGGPGSSIVDFMPPSLVPNTWYFITVTRSGDTFSVYWNGAPAASTNLATNLDTTASMKLGHRGSPSDTPGSTDTRGFYLNGQIDEVEVYNRALTNAEIQGIYNADSAGKCKTPSFELQIGDTNKNCEAIGGTWNSDSNTCTQSGDLNNPVGVPGGIGLTIDAGVTLVVNGRITNDAIVDTNYGTININSGGQINTYFGGTVTNYGTINISSGGRIYFGANGILNNNAGGTINNNSVGAINDLTNKGGIDNNGGDINNAGTIINNNGGLFTNNYNISAPIGGFKAISNINNAGTLTNSGTLDNNPGNFINNNNGGTINNPSTINNKAPDASNNLSGATINNSGIINNPGTINKECGSTITGNAVTGNPVNDLCTPPPPPTITVDSASDTTPKWGEEITAKGTVTNSVSGDSGSIDWGDSTTSPASIVEGMWSQTHTYAMGTEGLHNIVATLIHNTSTDPSAPFPITVVAHPTMISLNAIGSQPANNQFTIYGDLIDTFANTGVAGKIITTSTGSTPLPPDATTNGVTISDSLGITGNGESPIYVSLHPGTDINTPSHPQYVVLYLTNIGTDIVTVSVTDGAETPSTQTFTGQGQGVNIGVFTISMPNGISNIHIVSESGESTVNISRIQTIDRLLTVTNDIQFSTTGPLGNSISFNNGRFNAVGQAPTVPSPPTPETMTTSFAGDIDYLASSATQNYATQTSTTGGVGGIADTVTPDIGIAITAVKCNSASDGDAICDDWKANSGQGVPFTAGTTLGNFRYPLTGAAAGQKDLFVEIDSMPNQMPSTTALDAVATAFLNSPAKIHLHYTLDEAVTQVNTISAWSDGDTVRTNDYDSIKADQFGTSSEHPVLGGLPQTNTASAPGTSVTVTVSSFTLSIPTNSITAGKTSGTITYKVDLGLSAPITGLTGITLGPVTPASSSASGLMTGQPTAQISTGSLTNIHKTLVISVPFSTDGPISGVSVPSYSVTVNFGTITETVTPTTKPLSPNVFTTLQAAKAQTYHYVLFANSIGGPSGEALLRSNKAVISLGVGFTGAAGSLQEQEGTFMHEFGHMLNLKHGGPAKILSTGFLPADSGINCKPNYESIMSYSRQLPNYLGGSWVLDYSHGAFTTPLTESSLTETGGNPVSSIPVFTPTIIWGTLAVGNGFLSQLATPNGSPAGNIDWNGINGIEAGIIPPTRISNFGMLGCNELTATSTPYNDYNDWGNLDFDFRQGPAGAFSALTPFVSVSGPALPEGRSIDFAGANVISSMYLGPLPPVKKDGTSTFENEEGIHLKFKLFASDGKTLIKPSKTVPIVPYAEVSTAEGTGSYEKIGTFHFDKGDKGLTGDQGLIGEQGPRVDEGLTGDKGTSGDKGDKGDEGCQCYDLKWKPHKSGTFYLKFFVPVPGGAAPDKLLIDPNHIFFDISQPTQQVTIKVKLGENHNDQQNQNDQRATSKR